MVLIIRDKMKTAGIIAEYNPFHNGHKYHIEKTRKLTGADGVIVVMSGNFVQRGEYAICDKWSRAKMAICGGADLVIELPVIYSCQSAEFFAKGAVSILENLNCNYLSFGTEADDTEEIIKIAEFLKNPDDNFKKTLEESLQKGESYPKALSKALGKDEINTPNNVLAIEYVKQIKNMIPVGVKRQGSLHDGKGSASDIRFKISNNENAESLMPQTSLDIFKNSGIANREAYEKLVLYKLRTMTADELKNVPDVNEGLENRIIQCAHKATTLDELLDLIKTKRYTMARIRRILNNALLGITKDYITKAPEYIRVLGMNKTGMEILASLRDNTDIPIITKVADAPKSKMLDVDINATNIYSLLADKPSMADYTTAPAIYKY